MKSKVNSYTEEESKLLISHAICHFALTNNYNNLTKDQIKNFMEFINPGSVTDAFILDPNVIDLVNFNSFPKRQIIRLIQKDASIVNRIDVNKFEFRVKELESFFQYYPHYVRDFIELLEINLKELTSLEVLILIRFDINFINDIEVDKIEFNRTEYMYLIKHFHHVELIMSQLNLKLMDHFVAKELIILSGAKYLDKINQDNLSYLDWLDILVKRPELLKYCNLTIFERGDCYYLAKLACYFDELYDIIEEHKDDISALGWEKLIMHNDVLYTPICNFNKFKNSNWNNILPTKPWLSKFKKI